ncbi:MAG: phosphate ABC transporter, permease protein PstA [Cycloclasticus sp.]|nr:phosphate ABC transporter, permease protein PstA [Cycloclasticus sp.]MBG95376.1 phosphate ABC transporter, permease protein PstA [Cycloclasticus sp.]HAI97138.1 phosphate ABC transporter permease PtsA [Methylococcaceae bacterium]
MNNQQADTAPRRAIDVINAGMDRRKRSEKRFQLLGKLSIALAIGFLAMLLGSIVSKGYGAFQQTYVKLDVHLDAAKIDAENLNKGNYSGVIKEGLRNMFPDVSGRREKRKLYSLVSQSAAYQLQAKVIEEPGLIGQAISIWVPADDEVDVFFKGHINRDIAEEDRRIKDNQIRWIDHFIEQNRIEKRFNTTFFNAGDSRNPESAGIWGAVVGSFYTLLVTLLLSFPVGVASAIYLEEFAPKNKFIDFIEVNINNLAAVPSIIFGLLGLAIFINFFGLPRSASFVGGLVLTLMTLPTIIISSRAALKSVPPSIKQAALGVGASPMQAIFYHVLPLAMPGILTGTILGMAQALGESAPLLMIGMVAFIVDIPAGIFDPSTVLPVQIFLWADSPERAFLERTSGAIMVLLGFLVLMNMVAVILRKQFERRW